jgi:hypothetical protein
MGNDTRRKMKQAMKTTKTKATVQSFVNQFEPVSIETVETLIERGLFHLPDRDHWRFGDEHNGTTRRLDDRKWKRGDNNGADWHKLIGRADVVRHDRRHVVFVIEGSKDALAAAELANRCGTLKDIGIVCALGSGYRPIPTELQQLRGRRVLLIGDNDAAGENCANIVAAAMLREKIDFTVWDWSRCPENAKDLFELIAEFPEQAETQFSGRFDFAGSSFFSPLSPSYTSTRQPFNPSTNKTGISNDELLGIVTPHIVSAKGTGNAMSFRLARAIKNRKFNNMQIEEIFELWFQKSKSLLPPDADESESLETFHRQMQLVRFTDQSLEAACERAASAKPPFIPARDGDEEIERLAALCRELQRESGDKPFICPVSVAQQFLGLRFATAANRLLHELEDEKVIECVERGAPNKKGEKGRPTMWRYKLPLDQ